MYGTATFVFVTSGNLTAATDSFLPIDPNYYPYLTSSDFDTINIYAGFNRFIVDYAYVEYRLMQLIQVQYIRKLSRDTNR